MFWPGLAFAHYARARVDILAKADGGASEARAVGRMPGRGSSDSAAEVPEEMCKL